MECKFDKEQPSVLLGLGIDPVEFEEKSKSLLTQGSKINEVVEAVLKSELSDSFKLALLFEIGANFGQNIMANRLAEEASKTQTTVLRQLSESGQVAH